jgi:hypothetical protein
VLCLCSCAVPVLCRAEGLVLYLDNTQRESHTWALGLFEFIQSASGVNDDNLKVVEEGDIYGSSEFVEKYLPLSFPRRSASRNTPLTHASEAPRPRKAAMHAHHPQLQSSLRVYHNCNAFQP